MDPLVFQVFSLATMHSLDLDELYLWKVITVSYVSEGARSVT